MKNESPITPATQTLNTPADMGREDDWHDLLYVNKKPSMKKNPKEKLKVGYIVSFFSTCLLLYIYDTF